ncbi:MAG: FtsQ-type POTRA domain-containing protein [Desulfatiglans sp.]|jgi:cell division protein FtsQ|nr:FtsQ-type POTRA domain-containing protein [Thermodesulfobacteriota bacterium]MEE4351291.1 FtsQ-type POTRA domain-containing protein [Desulfatiglans sp.]
MKKRTKRIRTNRVTKRKKTKQLPDIFRWLGPGFVRICLFVACVSGISVVFLWGYQILTESDFLKLRQIRIEGANAELRRELIDLSGLNAESNVFTADLNSLKEAIETHVWVRTAEVERRLPDTIIIRVEREIPFAVVRMDHSYYMNRYGEIFKKIERFEDMDLPIVTGIAKEPQDGKDQLERAAFTLRSLESEKGLWSLAELSEIHVKSGKGLSLYFNHVAAEIKIVCEDFTGKIKGLRKVTEHLRRSGRMRQVKAIDMNHVDGAVVSFRTG